MLCCAIAAAALAVEHAERRLLGHPFIEGLVVAILLGMALRTVWQPPERFRAGIAFGAKQILEVAVALLGAAISLSAILASGTALLLGIAAIVTFAMAFGWLIARGLGLPSRMAILIACGNAICGNSAIVAVAPIIGADAKDVAASIAFTAVIGVLVVLGLPLLVPLAGLSQHEYGIVAGLTVYAVPQVLAATVPVGVASVQVGTLVKLVRVLMLGPMILVLSLVARRLRAAGPEDARLGQPGLGLLVPWFIVAFLVLAAFRSAGLIPDALASGLAAAAGLLAVASMAALGLGVDVRALVAVGPRVTAAVTGSLLLLIAASLVLVRIIPIG
ncbi:YeiH family protein [Enterovirga aerilata]|uniref:Putative sulfate exporter family transporter n=1 Tax=Enterovirga aerilata TaxID=2730920 RepID=A0A849I610_9HYPH|nr:putative sulfate exporter family transporter [Enterovirga sp. DB1703]NNM71477.1 putative sulfate exporter family transporter [Enterovirga sp. DB1703]